MIDLGSPFTAMTNVIEAESAIGREPGALNSIHTLDEMRVGIKRRLADHIYQGIA